MRRPDAPDPWPAAVLFQGGLIPLALVLALAMGLQPWLDYRAAPAAVALGVLTAFPPVLALAACARAEVAWFRETAGLVRPLIVALFDGRGIAAIAGVAVLAGIGEELLFRGVFQAWLAGAAGPWPGLFGAALLFGLLHALSRTYFVLATAMGLYLGALYQFTGNLLPPTVAHALYDIVAIVYLLGTRGEDETPGGG